MSVLTHEVVVVFAVILTFFERSSGSSDASLSAVGTWLVKPAPPRSSPLSEPWSSTVTESTCPWSTLDRNSV